MGKGPSKARVATNAPPNIMTEQDIELGGDQHSSLSQLWWDWPNPRLRVCLPVTVPSDVSVAPHRVRFAPDPPQAETSQEPYFGRWPESGLGGFTSNSVVVKLPPVDRRRPAPKRQEPGLISRIRSAMGFSKPHGLRLRRRGRCANALDAAAAKSEGWWEVPSDGGETSLQRHPRRARAWLHSYGGGVLSKAIRVWMVTGDTITRGPDGDPIWYEASEGLGPREERPVGVKGPEWGKKGWQTTRHVCPLLQIPFAGDNGDIRFLWVSPELVAALSAVRMFRSASSTLLGSLRGHARRWAEERGINAMDLVRFLPGTLILAMLPMPDEVVAAAALRGAAGRYSVDVLGALESGVAKGPEQSPLGDFLKGPVSWLFRKTDRRVLAPGVDTLKLTA